MRLRYLYIPDYGPLKNIAVVFNQNNHIKNRPGSINFVVGLNGSGKSSLLRVIYAVFLSLTNDSLPSFPVTMIYELTKNSIQVPIILHRPQGPASDCFLVPAKNLPTFSSDDDWQRWVETTVVEYGKTWPGFVRGDQLLGNGEFYNHLPERVLAYTSGDITCWQNMAYPSFPKEELSENFDIFDDRPYGWSEDKELSDTRASNLLSGPYRWGDESTTTLLGDRCIMLSPDDIRIAAISLGLLKAAVDMKKYVDEVSLKNYHKKILNSIDDKKTTNDNDLIRQILNELDWLWPTHVGFLLAGEENEERFKASIYSCYWLHALSDTVIRYPLNESLSVISLGHRKPVSPENLSGGEPLDIAIKIIGEPLRNAKSGAEALVCLCSNKQLEIKSIDNDEDIPTDKYLWDIFRFLYGWKSFGNLIDVLLTVKRIRPVPDASGESDDCIISYSSLSDGEQMILGRIAIFLLLRGQDNSLLLLDEPETHFNDAWKRQIIDMVDESILKNTAVHALVSTHTSLALTDVFSCEITRLSKEKGVTTVNPVVHPTFGADPGRLLLHVFGAPDVIGARAAEFLRSKLDPAKWPKEDREKLRNLIDEIGSGWPRAKLMEILDNLENPDASSHS